MSNLVIVYCVVVGSYPPWDMKSKGLEYMRRHSFSSYFTRISQDLQIPKGRTNNHKTSFHSYRNNGLFRIYDTLLGCTLKVIEFISNCFRMY